MWTPIKLTDKATGRSVHISIFERELYLSGFFSFEDFWAISQSQTALARPIAELLSIRPDLTPEQAEAVLQSAVDNSDADIGVTADDLEMWSDSLYPSRAGESEAVK